MNGGDIFGGRIPKNWRTPLPKCLEQWTSRKFRSDAQQSSGITETLLQIASIVSSSQPVHDTLTPGKSLLFAFRQLENIDHVLLIAESLSKH